MSIEDISEWVERLGVVAQATHIDDRYYEAADMVLGGTVKAEREILAMLLQAQGEL